MAKPLLPEALWTRLEPWLPKPKPRNFRFPGRKPLEHRAALTGILFVLRTGIRWNDLPMELGCGSGSACRKRLQEWARLGIWDRLHRILIEELDQAHKIDWSRAAVDSSSHRALGGGEETGKNPTDRGRLGGKHHAVVDARGVPLAVTMSAANVHDVAALMATVNAIPSARRPDVLYGDRAYHSRKHEAALAGQRVEAKFARRGEPHGSGLGVFRWPVERFFSWLHRYRKLRLRTDWYALTHNALLKLGTALICLSFLDP